MKENNFLEFSTFQSNGEIKPMSKWKEHLKEISTKEVTYDKKLMIGDIVKLKNSEHIVKIKSINCKIGELGTMDYEGVKVNEPNKGRSYFFNQKDIDKLIGKQDKEEER